MRETPYYSVRAGRHPTAGRLDLDGLKELVLVAYLDLRRQGYFQEVLGTDCVDGDFPGSVGEDVAAFFFRSLRKRDLWPIEERIATYLEDDLFDVVELLHDCASKGVDGTFHSYAQCGMHYETFEQKAGRNDFRVAMNPILGEYSPGYQLTSRGEVVQLGPKSLRDLERAPNPPGDPSNVQARVNAAVDKFRRRGASTNERRDSIRDLADVLEYLRPQMKEVLASKDEADLFELANRFGIRHHNQAQQTKYDRSIWYSWMFYYYLASIHATTRLIARKQEAPKSPSKKQ